MIEYTKEELEEKQREESRKYLGYAMRHEYSRQFYKTVYDFIPMCPTCKYKKMGNEAVRWCEHCIFNKRRKSMK